MLSFLFEKKEKSGARSVCVGESDGGNDGGSQSEIYQAMSEKVCIWSSRE